MEAVEKEAYRQEFCKVFKEKVTREGGDRLLAWLSGTDFFTAPASTKYHGACECGLVMHSVNVYNILRGKYFDEGDSEESFALCALLHDVCKAQFYKVSTRNVKNDATGAWEKVPYYTVEDAFPYGHGEKSVYLIERFVRLKPAEAMAIRWHMGGFDIGRAPVGHHGRGRRRVRGRDHHQRAFKKISRWDRSPAGRESADPGGRGLCLRGRRKRREDHADPHPFGPEQTQRRGLLCPGAFAFLRGGEAPRRSRHGAGQRPLL